MSPFKTKICTLYGNKGKVWLEDLPHHIEKIAKDWGLSNLNPVSNLSYNYVLSGFRGTQPIILKLGFDEEGLQREARALRAFEGFGAVKVLEERPGELLLERAVPGLSLKDYNKKKAIQISCQVMKQLHQAPIPPGSSFPSIDEWLKALDRTTDIPQHFLKKARHLRDRLSKDSSERVLLHGDLHHENILLNGKDWVVIDPKGVIGTPIHETWAFVMDFERDTQFVADFFSFPPQDVRSWYFVHLMLAACWNVEDKISPTLFLNLAEKTYPLV